MLRDSIYTHHSETSEGGGGGGGGGGGRRGIEGGSDNFSCHRKYISHSPPPPLRSSGRGRPPKEPEATPTSDPPTQEEPTEELLNWQGAIAMVTSASQLAVLASQLNSCVAWEKSPTKVVSSLHTSLILPFSQSHILSFPHSPILPSF